MTVLALDVARQVHKVNPTVQNCPDPGCSAVPRPARPIGTAASSGHECDPGGLVLHGTTASCGLQGGPTRYGIAVFSDSESYPGPHGPAECGTVVSSYSEYCPGHADPSGHGTAAVSSGSGCVLCPAGSFGPGTVAVSSGFGFGLVVPGTPEGPFEHETAASFGSGSGCGFGS